MEIKSLSVGLLEENVYFCYNPETSNCILIDPGDEANTIISFIDNNCLNLKAVLLTHGHIDHTSAIPKLKEKFDFKVYVHEKELPVLSDGTINFSSSVHGENVIITPDVLLKDDEVFSIDEFEFKVANTPGHTPGSCCYINFEKKVVFSGDTLFRCSVGRTDLPLSEPHKLKKAVHNKLFILDDDFIVYPGHDAATTIGYEKKYNILLR